MSSITINNISELPSAAKQLLQTCADQKIFAFYGVMGAGKTTFIKVICETLGVTDTISSPTFSIVNEYRSSKGEKIFHFDFYMGYEDYFYSNAYCFIEWPEKIEELLPDNYIRVDIVMKGEQPTLQRILEWSASPCLP
jgi:tRNA threonylcarbamoyladenosine biosynthesis protein TsaE